MTLADLFTGDGAVQVQLNDKRTVDLSALQAAVSGEPVSGASKLGHELDIGTALERFSEGLPLPAVPAVGEEFRDGFRFIPIPMPLAHGVDEEFREADFRLCKSLGITPEDGLATMVELWGEHTFTTERDRRAGPDANAQRKGQVSRQLKAELKKALADGNDQ